jgi:hypothetical protein
MLVREYGKKMKQSIKVEYWQTKAEFPILKRIKITVILFYRLMF